MASVLIPPVNFNDHIEGNESAAIELVKYGDYQCPHCGAAYPLIKTIQRRYSTQLRFIFRNFPLSDAYPFALRTAVAAEAAGWQHKFWAMHDVIFEHQRFLSTRGIFNTAAMAGLDPDRFSIDIRSEALQQKVEGDFESGIRSGVNGTPSFFINGKKFDGDRETLFSFLEDNYPERS